MAAPVIVWLRPGVGYVAEAAASMVRLERALGRQHDCNSSYRDYYTQLSMWRAWQAYVAGTGPYPGHSRALHPDASMHCQGLADDSDDWMTSGYIALAADHGWIRTAANDPTERHHFEYQSWRDNHRNEPVDLGSTAFPNTSTDAPTTIPKEWDEMATKDEIKAAMREVLAERAVGTLSIVALTGSGGLNLFSSLTGRLVRIENTYHLELIKRALKNTGNDGMHPDEVRIVSGYIARVNAEVSAPVPAPEVVDPPKA